MEIKYEFDGVEYDYSPTQREVDLVVTKCIEKELSYPKKIDNEIFNNVMELLYDLDVNDRLEERYEYELKEHFEKQAYEEFSAESLESIESFEYNSTRGV